MTDQAMTRPTKSSGFLLIFEWGGGTWRVTDRTYQVRLLGQTYDSHPEIEVEIPANIGTLKEEEWRIFLPRTPLTLRMSSGYAHAPVKVRVIELLEAESDTSRRTIFVGQAQKATRNAQGRRSMVRVNCASAKAALDVPLGMIVSPDCQLTFGSGPCGVALGPLRAQARVQAIDGALVTLQGLTPTTERYWHRGYVELDGLALGIRDQQAGNQVRLYEQPPADWLGATVTATPGCDKTAETCATKWSNIARFLGFGVAVPSYNPSYEEGGS